MSTVQYIIEKGRAHPLGATTDGEGVNFAIFSQHATSVELLLFDSHDTIEPIQIITLNPEVHKTFHFWHVYVKSLPLGSHYAYRIDGPWALAQGHRFNSNKILIDPYAKGNTNTLWDRINACGSADNLSTSLRSVVIDLDGYDWEGDVPIKHPMNETIIYEMHVGGFTRCENAKVNNPGTFEGIIDKIPYLQSLGITAVELLPVFEYDSKEIFGKAEDDKPLVNYWGYSTISYFSPHGAYCISPEAGTHIKEFRDMVKALHKAGIEVILDVVFNHSNEGNHQGPTINFKGIDNSIYYHLVPGDKQYYMDFSGCGNTLNCNHPIVEKLIVECLEFWVKEMHVDGFRFDEGSILARGQDGTPLAFPPVVWNIELSEALADTKIIAEAWDAAGLYQIGYFPGYRWAEWNGKFRDDIRRFVKGDSGLINSVAQRLSGSADLYQARGHLPINSINFITCHDGFTLNDLVSYNEKHNWNNGEENRDGVNENLSWNCGVEGATTDESIVNLRARQIKNFITILMLSQGVPMIVAGDEVRRTQGGNNNTYCHNNELNWFDWDLVAINREMFSFFSRIIKFRKENPILHRSRFFSGKTNSRGIKDIEWHSTRLFQPDWDNPSSRVLAYTMGGFDGDPDVHVMMNMYWEPIEFEVPQIDGHHWSRFVDTSLPSPRDAVDTEYEILYDSKYFVRDRSIVILVSGLNSRSKQ